MFLHEDRRAFARVVEDASEKEECPRNIVEKDYYVWLMLRSLAAQQAEHPSVFKGGTAMYDKLGMFNRFSEDIDLTVPVDDLPSRNQARKRLEAVALSHDLQGLVLDKTDDDYDNRRGSITSVYVYEPLFQAAGQDELRRAGRVKIEATSFTQSEPTEPVSVVPMVATALPVPSPFDIAPALLPSLTLERIFTDKLFAAQNYWLKGGGYLFDAAKHIYDLCVLRRQLRIEALLKDPARLSAIAEYTRREERDRLGSRTADMPLGRASVLTEAFDDKDFSAAYRRMQEVYVFKPQHRIPADDARRDMARLSYELAA